MARTTVIAALFGLAPAAIQASEVDAPLEVIVAPGLRVPDNREVLRGIYLMRIRQWPNGTPVRVFVMPENSPVHDRFSREKLGTYPYVLNRAWGLLTFTGTGLGPKVVHSQEEMERSVRSTPGAIGYRIATSPAGGGLP